jgi:toxin ParE1/3/4
VSLRVEKKRRAEVDLLEQYVYIGEDNIEAAERFLDAVENELAKLAEMPGMGTRREFTRPELQGIRSWRVKGFENYLIFYRVTEQALIVQRVLHGARDIEKALGE